MRIGHGFDVHAFGDGDHVMLGGVRIAHRPAASSRTAMATSSSMRCATRCSARSRWATSASIFRRSDPRWKDADSRTFLRHCARCCANAAGRSATPTSPSSASGRGSVRMCRRDARAICRRHRHRHRRRQRQGDDHRATRLHRPWRRHRRACRVPARARMSATAAARTARPCCRRGSAATPEDFLVEEIDGFEATGSGEHLLLTIEKRGMNTAFAAAQIARWAGVPPMGVGYAGLKDRHAVTRQRFSVHLPKRIAPDIASLRVARTARARRASGTAKKLPRGALAGNRFELVLARRAGRHGTPSTRACRRSPRRACRIISASSASVAAATTSPMRWRCSPAAASAATSARCCCPRRARNCSTGCWRRACPTGSWNRGLAGEVWMLDGSRSVFGPEPMTEAIATRLAEFDIHPTAPLWGRGDLRSTDDGRALEEPRSPTGMGQRCVPGWKRRAEARSGGRPACGRAGCNGSGRTGTRCSWDSASLQDSTPPPSWPGWEWSMTVYRKARPPLGRARRRRISVDSSRDGCLNEWHAERSRTS